MAARGSDYVAHDKEQLAAVTADGLEVSTLDPHPDRRWADLYQVGRLVRGDTPVEVSFGAWIDVVGRRAGSALHVVKDSADVSEPVEARSAGLPDRLQVLTGFPLPDLVWRYPELGCDLARRQFSVETFFSGDTLPIRPLPQDGQVGSDPVGQLPGDELGMHGAGVSAKVRHATADLPLRDAQLGGKPVDADGHQPSVTV